ncbi:MAG: SMP-30/gluconolactonase/LRE family protein [Acidobacteria bacterium]|nr:SMP-30/gluconolactonase/LRE family protein [Acidobacteriota bacterium]
MIEAMLRRSFLPLALAPLAKAEEYVYGPDSSRQPGVPAGKVTKHVLAASTVYPGTTHDYWVYVPAQYDAAKPAAVMIFQDGSGFVNETGHSRVPIVFDNLIHKGEMPVTIAILISPGVLPARNSDEQARFHRSYEYDAVTGRYARFLIEEILPVVGKSYNLTNDPNMRAISGSSSGGNCSVNTVWERPDYFRRVVSFIAGFTHQRGALILPSQVRKFEGKPLRILLQDGTGDVNYQSNLDMIAALDQAGYDAKFVSGTEGHNMKHGGPLLPDALRWVWRDWTKPIAKPVKSFAARFVDPLVDWELVSKGHRFTEGPAVDAEGNVYFSDIPNNRIHKAEHASGKVSVFQEDTGGVNGLMFGPDGRLYACQNGRKRIVAYEMGGGERVVAEGAGSNDLAVNAKGEIYFTDPQAKRVWFVNAKGEKRVVHEGISFPNGVRLSPDQSLLMVADMSTRWVWSFQVQGDGSLAYGVAFHRLEMEDEAGEGQMRSGADGFTVDTEGFLYVATRMGLQVNDPAGRTTAVLLKPEGKGISNAVFAGPGLDTLYVTAGDSVYRRKMKRKGVFPWKVSKPPAPRL